MPRFDNVVGDGFVRNLASLDTGGADIDTDPAKDHNGLVFRFSLTEHEGVGEAFLSPSGYSFTAPGFQNAESPGTDSIPGNSTSTVVLAIGGSQTGVVNTPGDDDWFRVDLVAGQSYVFTATGSGSSPLLDTYLELHDDTRSLIAIDDDAGPGTDSLLRFTATSSGTYFLNARAWEADSGATLTGGYTVTAALGPPQNPLDTINEHFVMPTSAIQVYFATSGQSFNGDMALRDWESGEINAAFAALATYSAVAPLTFTQTMTSTNADFILTLAALGTNVLGHFAPGVIGYGAFSPSVSGWTTAGLQPGGDAFATLVHEFGHALGLAHPHDNGGDSEIMQGVIDPFGLYGPYLLNQGVFTTMSYNGGWDLSGMGVNNSLISGSQATPMALDIALIQQNYGVNSTTNVGDTTYQLLAASGAYRAIWDAGGTDTISFGGSQNSTIDLRPATLLSAIGGGGYVSFVAGFQAGFTIAAGAVIENASGGSGVDVINGNAADNQLTGNGGNDTLNGNDGSDLLIGGFGADALDGGNGSDTAGYSTAAAGLTVDLATAASNTGDAAGDTFTSIENLFGSGFNDTLRGDGGANVLSGGAGVDILEGRAGNDTLSGGDGDDQLNGGLGADIIDGGAGFDTVRYDGATSGVTIYVDASYANTGEAAGDTTISIEGFVGSTFNDYMVGGTANNVLQGFGGADILEGHEGDDLLDGGDGDDQLNGGTGGDILDGGAGFDTARYDGATAGVTIYVDAAYANTGEAAGDFHISIEGLVGSTFGDYLVGGVANNVLQGFSGNDIIEGHEGDDLLDGGDGDDQLNGGTGGDILDGGAGFDTARYDGATSGVTIYVDAPYANTGEAAGDFLISIEGIVGSTFNDYLVGGTANNVLQGFSGNDILEGHEGNDLLDGGDGNDQLNGGTGADIFDGGAGFDTARYDLATAGVSASLATPASNTGEAAGDAYISIEALVGSSFNDTLIGNSAANSLSGLGGADSLNGGAGIDQLSGGAGDDAFVFQAGQANGDVVLDFAGNGAAAGDGFVFSGYGTALAGATFVQLDATHWQINSADGTIHDTITLANGASVDASDYIFGP